MKTTKGVGSELELETSNRKRGIVSTLPGDDIFSVTINSISLNLPTTSSLLESQRIFTKLMLKASHYQPKNRELIKKR